MTHYLKFTDEAEAISVLSEYRGTDENGNDFWLTASHSHALDVVGVIYAPTGVTLTDSDGIDYPETAPLPGFHVNFAGDLPAELNPYRMFPVTPARVFA